ncbi:MAG TPA: DUF5916 domain-containing protein, partial [Bacteroidales bacterium]|nr:DUF5916 domain-containing protein [Bacteroidales bacterium]
MNKLILLLALGTLSANAFSKKDTVVHEKKAFQIQKLNTVIPVIDGQLSESIWEDASWQSNFTQHLPNSGSAPSFQTRFTIFHDENYIYGAVECFDSSPDSIDRRMTRRDDVEGDYIMIGFDSYHDLRTAFVFTVSAGGAKGDMIMSEDGNNEDETWNPIWQVKTSVTKKSWIAEFKIPFSQLRFDNSVDGVWGFNIYRSIFRTNEQSYWQHISPDAPGLVHLFGELAGMKNVKPRKQAEIIPYVNMGTKLYEKDAENPFLTGHDKFLNTGFDAKLGITNNMTLDLSVNPDFGQVEADPSEVNLSAYESFYEEKRPLFIEGKNIYSFPIRWGGSAQNLFYSRRIGRKPHYYPQLNDGEYTRVPEQTNIIAAAKLSGKTRNGTSIGILETVTAEEFAEIDQNGTTRTEQVEPLTNYFVARVLQDINDGNTIIGGIVTSTYRDINTENLEFLPASATTGGIDFAKYWQDRTYHFKLVNYVSHVTGATSAITDLQQSPAHL